MDLSIWFLNTENFLYFIFFAIFCSVIVHVYNEHLTKKKPPGPTGFPIFGIFPFLGQHPYKKISEWAQKYGPVMRISFGMREIVILNDHRIVRETFHKEEFTGKPHDLMRDIFKSGIIYTDGPCWKRERTFAHSVLKQLGMGKTSFEATLHEKIDSLIDSIKQNDGKPFDISRLFTDFTGGIITDMLFGNVIRPNERFDMEVVESVSKLLDNMIFIGILDALLPFLKFIPFLLPNIGKTKKATDEVDGFIREKINRVREEFDPNHIRGYVDAYLKMVAMEKHDTDYDSLYLDMEASARDLYIAGIHTSAVTLEWAILYLLLNQELQTDLQNEIERHIGFEMKPSALDKRKLVLVTATINEVSRCATVVPFTVSHVCHTDAYIEDFLVKKDTPVIENIWHIHHDPKLWTNPERFDPYRFIDKDGALTNTDFLLPFSVGRRACPGEPLANMEIFLALVSLLQKFTFLPENKEELPGTQGICGSTISPKPFRVRAVEKMMNNKD